MSTDSKIYHFNDFFIECTYVFWLINTFEYILYLFGVICVIKRLKGLLVCRNYVQIAVLSIVLFATELIYSIFYYITTD